MKLWKYISLLFIGIIGNTYAEDFYVAAPSSLQLNTDQNIAIAVDGQKKITATIQIQDYPRKNKLIFEKNVEVKGGEPKLFKVNLNANKFPEGFLTGPDSPKLVSVNVRVQNNVKEIQIPISKQGGYMFIQSDKPIYNPQERANFRMIPLTEEGLPSNEMFKLEIKNPHGIVVDKKVFNDKKKPLPFYMGTHPYKFPEKFPVLGEWKAIVYYGHNLERNSSITFELKEYVLPTFTLELETPNVILETATTITIKLTAKHVYGENVKGVVTFRIGIKKERTSAVTYLAIINPTVLSDEMPHKVVIATKELEAHKDIEWFPDGSFLVVEANVIDDATGKRMVEVDSSTRFSKSPFFISFKRCLRDFRPGLPSVFEADITYYDGKPAVDIPTKISAVADDGKKIILKENAIRSNQNGKVDFEIQPEIHHKKITITLETDDETYQGSQAKGTFVQEAYQSRSSAYIGISRSTPLRIQPGDTFTRDVHFKPKEMKNMYYMVVAKGRILSISKFPDGEYVVRRIEFRVTHEMVPSFRVVVFAHFGNDFIADSLKIEVENICHPKAKVTLEKKFKQETPASDGKIIMHGTKDTSVGLLGVNKAVYALSKKELLTKEKMFETLGSHDLGCGPGGGSNVNFVLGNAGITIGTNKFTPSETNPCGEIRRKKRSTEAEIMNLVNRYSGKKQVCCGLGLNVYKNTGSCENKQEAAEEELMAIHQNCSEIFLECCMEGKRLNLTGFLSFAGGRIKGDDTDELEIDFEKFERQTTIRKDFRETLVFSNFLIGPDGKHELDISLPHSITTWVVQAVSVNPEHGICVAEEKEIVAFRRMFLHVNIPYSVKLYEQLNIEVTVFNYMDTEQEGRVYMEGVADVCSNTRPGKRSVKKTVVVQPNSAETVTFPIIPLQVKKIPIKFFLASFDAASDIVQKELNVVPQGVREKKEVSIKLDPTNRQKTNKRHVEEELYSDIINESENLQVTAFKIDLPIDTVPGTAVCKIVCSGDMLGPAIESTVNNPDTLIKMPRGCGEQNLVHLAPTVYTMRYLKSSNRLTPERRDKGTQYIRLGYDNELKFKKADGSYSVWAHTPTSTWLTAFVVKVFCQATEFIPIDPVVISSGLNWLVKNQQADGSFIEKHIIYHQEMMGGVDGTVSMTAFALIALEECKVDDESVLKARQRAVVYLERQIANTHTPLPAAVVAYALALSNSQHKKDAYDKLMSMSKRNREQNYLHWITANSARDIETAGYGLLTLLLFDDISNSSSIVNWLNTKQLQSGEFKSTQDTVISLQALSEYAIREKTPAVNLVANISSSHNQKLHETFYFNNSNALEVQELELEDPEGYIFVKTAGYGMGSLSMKLYYNVIKPNAEICKFDINVTLEKIEYLDAKIKSVGKAIDKKLERRKRAIHENYPDLHLEKEMLRRVKREDQEKMKNYALKVNICVRYLGGRDTEMSIVDVGLFSGFEPSMERLDELVKDERHYIQRYEKSNRGIVFYLEKVPAANFYCFSFDVHREYIVEDVQSSVIEVYDYYNPDEKCIKFYSPKKEKALLRKDCRQGVCTCAEGGCAPKDPFKDISHKDNFARRDDMITMFCEKFDYVWIARINGRMMEDKENGYYNITLLIEEVIKPGTEPEDVLINQNRTIRYARHCPIEKFFPRSTYIVMGKDPPGRKLREDSELYFLYVLEDTSIILPWTLGGEAENEELQGDLEYIRYELKSKGCNN